MSQTTANQHGYAANVTDTGPVEGPGTNFSQNTAAENITVAQLSETNNFIQGHLEQVAIENHDLQEQLVAMQQQLHQMNLAQSQRQPPFQQPSARPPMPPPQMFQQQQMPQFNVNHHPDQMQWQQPMNMNQAPPRRNGRNCGRGNSSGRGMFQGNNQNQYQNQFNSPPTGQQRPNPPSNVKRNANNNYCFTHGHNIADSHTSATCGQPVYNHNYHATKMNTMGGSNNNIENTQWPVKRQPAQQTYHYGNFQQQDYGQY